MIKLIGILAVSMLALSGCTHNYGVTHGLGTGAAVCAAGYGLKSLNVHPEVVDAVQIGITVVATGLAYKRESDARGGIPFDEWDEEYGSVDTQLDAIMPAVGGLIGTSAC